MVGRPPLGRTVRFAFPILLQRPIVNRSCPGTKGLFCGGINFQHQVDVFTLVEHADGAGGAGGAAVFGVDGVIGFRTQPVEAVFALGVADAGRNFERLLVLEVDHGLGQPFAFFVHDLAGQVLGRAGVLFVGPGSGKPGLRGGGRREAWAAKKGVRGPVQATHKSAEANAGPHC